MARSTGVAGGLVFPASSLTFTVAGGSSRCSADQPPGGPEGRPCEPLSYAPSRSFTECPGHRVAFSLGSSTQPRTRALRCACLPSIDVRAKRPLPEQRPAVPSVSRVPPPKSCSILVVLHHPDGFLRSARCGLVASRCRPWGSPRFRAARSGETGSSDTFPRRRTYPSKKSPPTAALRHRRPCTPCRSLRITASSRQGPLLEILL
jgi:hypothetical protein